MRRKDVTRGSAPPQEDEDVDEREQREPSSKRGRYWNARKALPKKKSVGSGMTLVSNASLFLIFASSILAVNHLTGGEILDQVRETISINVHLIRIIFSLLLRAFVGWITSTTILTIA